jgi:hypothetical protein
MSSNVITIRDGMIARYAKRTRLSKNMAALSWTTVEVALAPVPEPLGQLRR